MNDHKFTWRAASVWCIFIWWSSCWWFLYIILTVDILCSIKLVSFIKYFLAAIIVMLLCLPFFFAVYICTYLPSFTLHIMQSIFTSNSSFIDSNSCLQILNFFLCALDLPMRIQFSVKNSTFLKLVGGNAVTATR